MEAFILLEYGSGTDSVFILHCRSVGSQIRLKATNGILAKKETGRRGREQQNRIRRFANCKSTECDKVECDKVGRIQQFSREHCREH